MRGITIVVTFCAALLGILTGCGAPTREPLTPTSPRMEAPAPSPDLPPDASEQEERMGPYVHLVRESIAKVKAELGDPSEALPSGANPDLLVYSDLGLRIGLFKGEVIGLTQRKGVIIPGLRIGGEYRQVAQASDVTTVQVGKETVVAFRMANLRYELTIVNGRIDRAEVRIPSDHD